MGKTCDYLDGDFCKAVETNNTISVRLALGNGRGAIFYDPKCSDQNRQDYGEDGGHHLSQREAKQTSCPMISQNAYVHRRAFSVTIPIASITQK